MDRQPSSYREAAARSAKTEHKAQQQQPTISLTEDPGPKGEQKTQRVGPTNEHISEITSSSQMATSAVHTQVVTGLSSEAKVTKDVSQPESNDPIPSAKHYGTDRETAKEKTVKSFISQ